MARFQGLLSDNGLQAVLQVPPDRFLLASGKTDPIATAAGKFRKFDGSNVIVDADPGNIGGKDVLFVNSISAADDTGSGGVSALSEPESAPVKMAKKAAKKTPAKKKAAAKTKTTRKPGKK